METESLLHDLDTMYHFYIANKDKHLEIINDICIDHILIAIYISLCEAPLPQLNKVYIKKSDIHGHGVFAGKDIKKGEILTIYPTDVIRLTQGKKYYQMHSDRVHQLEEFPSCAYKINEHCTIIGQPDLIEDTNLVGHIVNDAYKTKYQNNCIYYPYHLFILIMATKDIKKDEELLVSYGDEYWKVMK